MQEINKNLLQYLNSLGENIFFEIFVKIFVDAPIFILPIFLAGFWIYYSFLERNQQGGFSPLLDKKQDLIFIFYGIVFAIITSLLIQQFIIVERPEQHLGAGAKLLLDHLPDASFPSDHATVSIAFLTGLLLSGYKKYFWFFLLPILAMNTSRIIAGVHWPFDIIAGGIVGIFISIITFQYYKKIKLVKKLNLKIIKLLNYIKL
ncbi:MAG: phosphatase PAP2 family protein [Candidatus Gracilibacteria bacterium]|nr:phosphatase PAP2 family protein [Candidatus Gracilibacteria bacterium]